MSYRWENCPQEVKDFIQNIKERITEILDGNLSGIYLHGSLAMGGFHPKKSDIDVIVVTKRPLEILTQKDLAQLFLAHSDNPYPVEISFLYKDQLTSWQHPCPYDFHYSEYWREKYTDALTQRKDELFSDSIKVDGDLAAHFMILNTRGIVLSGKPIEDVFSKVPKEDYLDSILNDYEECLEEIYRKPVYAVLNMLRVLWYLKEGKVSSKEEAGNWGVTRLPEKLGPIVQKANESYRKNGVEVFSEDELKRYKRYIRKEVEELIQGENQNDYI